MNTSSRFLSAKKFRRGLAVVSAVLLLSSAACIHAAETLIPLGATWHYRALGVDLGTAWRETNYNDSARAAGPSQLGAGH